MSFIARCPACQTSYKVVPDQLRISDGWVRCGQCGEIFDASQQLTQDRIDPAPDPAQPYQPALPLQSSGAGTQPQDETIDVTDSAQGNPPLATEGDVLAHPSATDTFQPDSLPEAAWESAALLVKPSADVAAEVPSAPEPVPVVAAVSFLSAPEVRQNTGQKGKRLLWGGVSILLLLGLLMQVVYRERDQLAAIHPDLKPALQSFCGVLECRVLPLQHIEAFVLDSATFHQVDQETHQLHWVVKNKSRLALALPAVELTLTDLADQPVIRRVFTPAELSAMSDTVPAAGDWSVTTYVHVKADAGWPRALGYRLLVFYP
jgi:predicted Zn finger-like uncharacterized protein